MDRRDLERLPIRFRARRQAFLGIQCRPLRLFGRPRDPKCLTQKDRRRSMLRRITTVSIAVMVLVAMQSGTASAQGTGSIAGVVKDASGAVLPGVTVEASSPA